MARPTFARFLFFRSRDFANRRRRLPTVDEWINSAIMTLILAPLISSRNWTRCRI